MKLYLYFARRFAWTLGWMFALFVALSGLLEMIEVLRLFAPAGLGLVEILRLTALRLPTALYQILPLVVILSTLSMFLGLARSSELVVVRAAGRSALKSLLSPLAVAFLAGVLFVAVFNPIVAATSQQYELLFNRYLKGRESVLSITREGLWLRQGDETGQTVIRASRANLDGTELRNVTFFGFSRDGVARYRIEARSARLVPGAWELEQAKRWRFDSGDNPEAGAERLARLSLPSPLTADQIRDGFGTPAAIPIWELPAFIERLRAAGFSARRHQVWLQTELAQPLLLVTMVMIGAAFTMRPGRLGRTGLMVLLALGLGFGLYFIRNLAQVLGENGQLPVALAAWAPPLAGILLALGLLLHAEDG